MENGARFVIDDTARSLWAGFDGSEVLVRGGCYEPAGEASLATHFRVDEMKFAVIEQGRSAWLTVGPEMIFRGKFEKVEAPPRSKAEGTTYIRFRAEDGVSYLVVAEERAPIDGKSVRVRGRVLEPDMSYTARTRGPDLWIVKVLANGDSEGSPPTPTPIACP